MSFVDGRVIRQRMAKKDARMAKIAAKRLAKSAKIVGAAECSSTQTAPDRNGQTLAEGAHRVTAIPHSNLTPWQPIETAPNDGSWVLVYASFRIEIARWDKDWTRFRKPSPTWIIWRGGAERGFSPTHWMPLPSTPNTDGVLS